MNSTPFFLLATPFLLLLFSGCETLSNQRSDRARDEMSRQYLEQKVDRFESVNSEAFEHRRRLGERLDALERRSSVQNEEIRGEIQALTREVAQLRSDRERLRREIVDDITGQVSGIIEEHSARGGSARSAPVRQSGREHTVGKGHTISEIATAYGTTVQAIAEANNLKDPDKIRVGQKLFIPE